MILKKINIAFFIIFSLNSLGQTGQIYGKISDWRTNEPIPWATVTLLNPNNSICKGVYADSSGAFKIDSIKPGVYDLKVEYLGMNDSLVQKITVEDKNITNIHVVTKPCLSESIDTICPICHKKDMAIPVFKGISDVWFKNKRTERKYKKQIKKQGYEVDIIDKKEYLIRVLDENENKKKSERCNYWFCKRDKYIY